MAAAHFLIRSPSMPPADTGRPQAPAPASRGPLVGILLLVLSMWTLSCLDASGKWVMNAGVPLLVLSWFRYVVHLILVLALVLPTRGLRSCSSRR
jgi:hypothetical protein